MPTRIHEEDLMVLQRPGVYLDTDPEYPGMPGDIDIYNFTGADLKYSCQSYVREDGIFVLRTGDVMTGNLTIAKDDTPTFTMSANMASTSSHPFGRITFSNTYGLGSTLSNDIEIKAIGNEAEKMRLTVGTAVTIYQLGGISMTNYPVISTRKETATLAFGEVRDSYESRIEWGEIGGALRATELQQVRLEWNTLGGHLSSYGMDSIFVWNDSLDGAGNVVSSNISYSGDIINDKDIVTKEWSEDLASNYLPLAGGTMFGSIGMDVGSDIDAVAGHGLELKQNGEIYVTMGKNNGVVGDKITVEKEINLKQNVVNQVKYPVEIGGNTGSTTEDTHAVPKKYVDDRDDYLESLIDGLTAVASPPGMINGFAGQVADEPVGWLICDGRTISTLKADPKYSGVNFDDLKSVLGLTSDSGKIPDLRGRYIGGVDRSASCALGYVSGACYGHKTAIPQNTKRGSCNYPMYVSDSGCHNHCLDFTSACCTSCTGAHTHKYGRNFAGGCAAAGANVYSAASDNHFTTNSNGNHQHSFCVNGKSDCNGTHYHSVLSTCWDAVTMPKTYAANWIIKY